MSAVKHIAVCLLGVTLLVILPFLLSGGAALITGGTDAVSSASVVIDKPSGCYTVMINRGMHKNDSDLAAWESFFSGGDLGIIFDDVSCVILNGDAGALTLAESFMSRLPENQMKVTVSDAVLAVSKADCGRFDVMIVSDEFAELYGTETVSSGKNVDVIHITDEGDEP